MATLSQWQRIDRVLPGLPFGDAKDGDATISSDPNTRTSITGTATELTGTAGSTAFADGDLVKLIQTQGTNSGQYEINMVASGGGTTSLTFKVALHYTFGTGAQIIKIPRYRVATVAAHSPTAWNGTSGGHEIVLAKISITTSGILSASGVGFRGGSAPSTFGSAPGASGYRGEGQNNTVNNAGNVRGGGQTGADGIAGAGARAGGITGEDHNLHHSGGGGGHSTAGGNGYWATAIGGGIVGVTDLTTIFFGGAGGAGSSFNEQAGQAGRNSGGIVEFISNHLELSAAVNCNGVNGLNYPNAYGGAGGASAGGSFLGVCKTATLGSGLITAIGGTSPVSEGGSTGGVGRIAIHHSGTITGTTNPTFTDVEDLTLIETNAAILYSLI